MPSLITGVDLPEAATRRDFILAGFAVPLLVTGCGNPTPAPPTDASLSSGPWAFTDDRGVRVELPARPSVVVAEDSAAAAMWAAGVRPAATFGSVLTKNPQFAGEDVLGIDNVGAVYGELNLEKLAALRPDVIVVPSWPPYDPGSHGFANQAQMDRVAAIAPIVALRTNRPFDQIFARFGGLAKELGADPQAAEVTTGQAAFEAASQRVRAAVAGKALRVLLVSAGPTTLSVADLDNNFPEALLYRDLGVDVIDPDGKIEFGFRMLSWETADTYPADVIMLDRRSDALSAEKLRTSQPTWERLPAVQAGQVGTWWCSSAYKQDLITAHLNEFADLLERARPVT